MTKQVRFIREDRDFFRNYYREIREGGVKGLLYCTQPAEGMTLPQWEKAGEPLTWYVCTADGEPCHKTGHNIEVIA